MKNGITRLFAPFVEIRPGEETRLLTSFFGMLLIMVSYYILKSIRDSTLISELSSQALPYLYLSQAILTFLGTMVYNRVIPLFNRSRFLSLFILVMVIFNLACYSGLGSSFAKGFAIIFYLNVSTYILFLMSLFWSLNHDVFSTEEACRLFGVVLLGGQFGMAMGGQITQTLVRGLGTLNLILWSTVILILAGFCLRCLQGFNPDRERAPTLQTGAVRDFTNLWRTRHFRWIALIVLIGALMATHLDFQYKKLVEATIVGRDSITAHFGYFSQYGGYLNILFLLVFSSRLVGSYGPGYALSLYPTCCVLLSLLFFWKASLTWIMPLAILTAALNYSLYNMGKEVLYVPIPPGERYKLKPLVDAFGFRLGDALASFSQIVLRSLYFLPFVTLSFILSLVFILMWIPVIVMADHSFRSLKRGTGPEEVG